MVEMIPMARMDCKDLKDLKDHKVQLNQLDHQDPLISKDHKETVAGKVILEKPVHQEQRVHKVNLVCKEILDYKVLQVKEGREVYQDLLV